jgi:hypothetical protein
LSATALVCRAALAPTLSRPSTTSVTLCNRTAVEWEAAESQLSERSRPGLLASVKTAFDEDRREILGYTMGIGASGVLEAMMCLLAQS